MLLNKFIQWITTRIVDTLAHNRTFQRFAVRMDDKITANKQVLNKMSQDKGAAAQVVLDSVKSVDVSKHASSVMDFLKKVHNNVK